MLLKMCLALLKLVCADKLIDLPYFYFILEPFKKKVNRRRRNLRQETSRNFSVTGKNSFYR